MSRNSTIYVDVKSDATLHVPLPVREVNFPSAGSNVCLYDFAFLIDASLQKQYIGSPSQLDWYDNAYMDTVANPCFTWQLGGRYHHVDLSQQYVTATTPNFLDLTKLPATGEGEGGWNMSNYRIIPSISGYLLSGKHLRSLDDISRMYYDIKRCKVMRGSIGYDLDNASTMSRYTKDGSMPETRVDADEVAFKDKPVSVLPSVKNHRNFQANGRFAIVLFNAIRGDLETGRTETALKWKMVSAKDGTLEKSSWNSDSCRSFIVSVWGDLKPEYSYNCTATIEDVFWDVVFPCDYILEPWNWQPSF